MKKKMSLIDLNKNEIEKNNMKQLLNEEMENAKGGEFPKCWFPLCLCWCNNHDDETDDATTFFDDYYSNVEG